MGQASSAPSTPILGTPFRPGLKHKKEAKTFFTLTDGAPPLPTSAWRSRRGSFDGIANKKQSKSKRTVARRHTEEMVPKQKEVSRPLPEAQLEVRSNPPSVVIGGDDEGGLEGLAIRVAGRKLSRDDPGFASLELPEPLEVLHDQLSMVYPAQPTNLSSGASLVRARSAPSRASTRTGPRHLSAHPLPAASSSRGSPISHWSESSDGPSPIPPFETFRASLNSAQRDRLSALSSPRPATLRSTPSASSLSSPTSPHSDAYRTSQTGRFSSLIGRRNKRSKIRAKGPIVVIDARRVGSERYSMMVEAERKRSMDATSRATTVAAQRRWRQASTTSMDVWDSALPFPGRADPPVTSPQTALSPRFSTTPVTLSSLYHDASPEVQADARTLNRVSWIMLDSTTTQQKGRSTTHGFSARFATVPEATCTVEVAEIFMPVDTASPSCPSAPAPTRVTSPLPPNHPSRYHSRFAHVPSPPPLPLGRRASTSSLHAVPRPSLITRRRSSVHSPSPAATDVPFRAPARSRRPSVHRLSVAYIEKAAARPCDISRRTSDISFATMDSAEQAVTGHAASATRRRSPRGSMADSTGSALLGATTPGSDFPFPFSRPRPLTQYSQASSFPRSVQDDFDSPLVTPQRMPETTVGKVGNSGEFSMHTDGAVSRLSLADSVAPESVDACPAPPARTFPSRVVPPAPLNLSSHLHRSLDTTASSSPTTGHASTPSTASLTSSMTSYESVELLSVAGQDFKALQIDFTQAAMAGATFSTAKEDSPALSYGSLATFVLDDLLNDLTNGLWGGETAELPIIVTEKPPVTTPRPLGRLSLEQPDLAFTPSPAPSLPLALQPRSPPRFLSTFSFDPSPGTNPSRKLAPLPSPGSHPLDGGFFDSPFSGLHTPEPTGVDPESGYRFPPSPGAEGKATWSTLPFWTRASAGDALFSASGAAPLDVRRGTFPEWVPPSQRGKERTLFDALLARSALEEEEAKEQKSVLPREMRLGSADKRGFNKREISDWIVQARRENEVDERVDVRV